MNQMHTSELGELIDPAAVAYLQPCQVDGFESQLRQLLRVMPCLSGRRRSRSPIG